MTTVTDTETPAAAPAPKLPEELFNFSSWVHVGEGATECEHRSDGKCSLEHHFHAWVRLPNPYQTRDINEKAKAAQARRLRMLKDPESDASVILESELDDVREAAQKGALDVLVDEILDQDHPTDLMAAVRNARERDDPTWEPDEDGAEDQEPPKLFANIDADMDEWRRQNALPEEDRGEDFEELQKTAVAYNDAVKEELESIRNPKRAELAAKPLDDLMEMVRKDRRESDAAEAYLHTYHSWQIFMCTYKPKEKGVPNVQVFSDYEVMRKLTPGTVLQALRDNFDRLSREFGMAQGNS